MTITIDKDEALRLLNEAVKIKGADHIQDRCYYAEVESRYDDDTGDYEILSAGPGCIVGQALIIKKPDMLDTFANDLGLNEAAFDFILDRLSGDHGIKFTPEAQKMFHTAQIAQDGRDEYKYDRKTWGEAVALAVESV